PRPRPGAENRRRQGQAGDHRAPRRLVRPREEDRAPRQGQQAEGPGQHPGRLGARERRQARRPAGGDRAAEEGDRRRAAVVHQLPRLTIPTDQARGCLMATPGKPALLGAAAPSSPEEPHARLAVLIDADNAQASIIEGLLAEIAKFGIASVKRIYGDWTQPQLGSWKKILLEHSIVPVQQFGYTKGKNATDSSLIIDAMDLLYTGRFDGFCLVSSDSDFTRLASRLREQGLTVYGFGERKTPEPFVAA